MLLFFPNKFQPFQPSPHPTHTFLVFSWCCRPTRLHKSDAYWVNTWVADDVNDSTNNGSNDDLIHWYATYPSLLSCPLLHECVSKRDHHWPMRALEGSPHSRVTRLRYPLGSHGRSHSLHTWNPPPGCMNPPQPSSAWPSVHDLFHVSELTCHW